MESSRVFSMDYSVSVKYRDEMVPTFTLNLAALDTPSQYLFYQFLDNSFEIQSSLELNKHFYVLPY